jgi:hypothetical protein
MNRDDIIRMAREAGLHLYVNELTEEPYAQILERFAHLVYEATFRDANIAASRTILDAAVLQEREACAKLAEETVCATHLPTGVNIYGSRVAKAIRERSNP